MSSNDAARAAEPQTATAQRRREELVELAARLFDRDGYHQTSVAQLAAAAGIAKATLYHYFSSKEEILIAIHGVFMDPLIEDHQRRLESSLAPSRLLLEVMVDIVGLMRERRDHVRVFFEHHRDLPESERAAVTRQRWTYQSMIEDVIERGIAAGEFRADVVPRIAALTMFGACNWTYQWYDPSGPMSAREVATEMWKYLLVGLSAERQDG